MNKPELVSIGVIVGTFGNKGELKVKILSDYPELLDQVPQVFIELKTEVIPGFQFLKKTAMILWEYYTFGKL